MVESTSLLKTRPGNTGPQVRILSSPLEKLYYHPGTLHPLHRAVFLENWEFLIELLYLRWKSMRFVGAPSRFWTGRILNQVP